MTSYEIHYKLIFTSHNTDESCVHQFLRLNQDAEDDDFDFFYVQETPYDLIVDGVYVLGNIPEWLAPYLVHYKEGNAT